MNKVEKVAKVIGKQVMRLIPVAAYAFTLVAPYVELGQPFPMDRAEASQSTTPQPKVTFELLQELIMKLKHSKDATALPGGDNLLMRAAQILSLPPLQRPVAIIANNAFDMNKSLGGYLPVNASKVPVSFSDVFEHWDELFANTGPKKFLHVIQVAPQFTGFDATSVGVKMHEIVHFVTAQTTEAKHFLTACRFTMCNNEAIDIFSAAVRIWDEGLAYQVYAGESPKGAELSAIFKNLSSLTHSPDSTLELAVGHAVDFANQNPQYFGLNHPQFQKLLNDPEGKAKIVNVLTKLIKENGVTIEQLQNGFKVSDSLIELAKAGTNGPAATAAISAIQNVINATEADESIVIFQSADEAGLVAKIYRTLSGGPVGTIVGTTLKVVGTVGAVVAAYEAPAAWVRVYENSDDAIEFTESIVQAVGATFAAAPIAGSAITLMSGAGAGASFHVLLGGSLGAGAGFAGAVSGTTATLGLGGLAIVGSYLLGNLIEAGSDALAEAMFDGYGTDELLYDIAGYFYDLGFNEYLLGGESTEEEYAYGPGVPSPIALVYDAAMSADGSPQDAAAGALESYENAQAILEDAAFMTPFSPETQILEVKFMNASQTEVLKEVIFTAGGYLTSDADTGEFVHINDDLMTLPRTYLTVNAAGTSLFTKLSIKNGKPAVSFKTVSGMKWKSAPENLVLQHSCAEGSHWDSQIGICRLNVADNGECMMDTIWNGSECVPSSQHDWGTCPQGQSLNLETGECLAVNSSTCRRGMVPDAEGHCVPDLGPSDPRCLPGQIIGADGQCLNPEQIEECPAGQHKDASTGLCVFNPIECPPGLLFNPETGQCTIDGMPIDACPPGTERNAYGICLAPPSEPSPLVCSGAFFAYDPESGSCGVPASPGGVQCPDGKIVYPFPDDSGDPCIETPDNPLEWCANFGLEFNETINGCDMGTPIEDCPNGLIKNAYGLCIAPPEEPSPPECAASGLGFNPLTSNCGLPEIPSGDECSEGWYLNPFPSNDGDICIATSDPGMMCGSFGLQFDPSVYGCMVELHSN